MPYSLTLPAALASQGWKVKIREDERLEPPHVTIIRGLSTWRISLRTGAYLDRKPDPSDVPGAVRAQVDSAMTTLVTEWNAKYPSNPV